MTRLMLVGYGGFRARRYAALIFALISLFAPALARAQDDENPAPRLEAFVEIDPQTGLSRIFFMDPLTGLSTVVNADVGQKFALVGDYVIYEKTRTGAVMRASSDGTLGPHPFVRRGIDTESITWVASPDRAALAWVQVNASGVSEAYVARADGSDMRQLPISTPGPTLELMPLALTNSMAQFFYDSAHPRAANIPFVNYHHLVRYSITDEAFFTLPGEPQCACGAAVSADGRIFARLEAFRDDDGPFGLRLWDLPTRADAFIRPPDLAYRMAGDLILSANGTLAAYGVAAGVGRETGLTAAEYAVVLVDLAAGRQVLALDPGLIQYRPLRFVDDGNTLLLASVEGTHKLDLTTGDLQRVSDKVYLGTILLE